MCLPWLEDWQAFHFLVTFLKIKLGWVSASIYLKIFSCCILSFLLQTPIRSMFDIRLLYIFPAVIWALFIFLVFFSASVSVCIVSLLDFKLINLSIKIYYGLYWLLMLPKKFKTRDFFYLTFMILYMYLLSIMVRIPVNYLLYSTIYTLVLSATVPIGCSLSKV